MNITSKKPVLFGEAGMQKLLFENEYMSGSLRSQAAKACDSLHPGRILATLYASRAICYFTVIFLFQ